MIDKKWKKINKTFICVRNLMGDKIRIKQVTRHDNNFLFLYYCFLIDHNRDRKSVKIKEKLRCVKLKLMNSFGADVTVSECQQIGLFYGQV